MKATRPPIVLTIAGSDSGAGAGIQADSRVIQALGGYATSALTAVTAQNTRGITALRPLPPILIAQQITAVCEDLNVRAIKTGLLPSVAAIREVVTALKKGARRLPVIVDPVLSSSSGTRFLPPSGIRVLADQLFPCATLVTPNWPEAALLAGQPVTTLAQAELAARVILKKTGCGAVLVKGGHGTGPTCEDILLLASGRTYLHAHRRIATMNTHGTGCVLSAAIATRLAFGEDLPTAVQTAIHFLQRALVEGRSRKWGAGRGPAFAGSIKSPSR